MLLEFGNRVDLLNLLSNLIWNIRIQKKAVKVLVYWLLFAVAEMIGMLSFAFRDSFVLLFRVYYTCIVRWLGNCWLRVLFAIGFSVACIFSST